MNKPAMDRIRQKECGAFFTPHWIASDMIRTHSIHRKWADGASVLDPTAGRGNLLESLIRCCLEDGLPVTQQMCRRLKGYEREAEFTGGFAGRMTELIRSGSSGYAGGSAAAGDSDGPASPAPTAGVTVPKNCLECRDFLEVPPGKPDGTGKFDIILGNPPWLNFTDVREEEKEDLKKFFIRYGLAGGSSRILLGSARIDLAALMIQKAMQDHLKPNGEACFFIPLSLVLNEGAHNRFRQGLLEGDSFSFKEIRDFRDIPVFPEVSTRSGFIYLQKSWKQSESLPYYTLQDDLSWQRHSARPVGARGSAYMVTESGGAAPVSLPQIPIDKASRPRQGINTGGRNALFIFDSCEDAGEGLCLLKNKKITALLPAELVYPLLTREQFRGGGHPAVEPAHPVESALGDGSGQPAKFIFLPYNSADGRVLSPRELERWPAACAYLEEHRKSLETRKGTLMGAAIAKGTYWSLLGVGPYSFSPWKIVWEAYGRDEFRPLLFGKAALPGNTGTVEINIKPWIVNQALQASCSFTDRTEAERVLNALRQPEIELVLKQQRMEGTCNWAQPGRIRHFLKERS